MAGLGSLGSLVVDVGANIAGFSSDMGRAAKIADQRSREIQRNVARATAAVAAAGVAAAGVASVAVKRAIDRADDLSKLSQKVGVSIESLAGLQLAGTLSGVTSIDGALKKLSKTAVEAKDANSTSGRAFKALGVDVRDASGEIKSNELLLREVSTAMAGFKDGAEKAAVAQAIFGRSGADLIPLLNGGSAGIDKMTEKARQLGLVIDKETGKAAENFNDQLTLGGKAVEGLATRVAAGLLPTLSDLTTEFVGYSTEASTATSITAGLDTLLRRAAATVVGFKAGFTALGETIGVVAGGIVEAFTTGNFSGAFANVKSSLADVDAQVAKSDATIQRILEGNSKKFEDAASRSTEASDNIKKALDFRATTGADDPVSGVSKSLAKASDALQKMDRDLQQQIATFGLSDAAVLDYRLTLGDLSNEVDMLGAAGQKLADSIRAQGEALDVARQKAEAFAQAQRDAQAFAQRLIAANDGPDARARADAIRRAGEQGGLGGFGRVSGGIAEAQDAEQAKAAADRERLAQALSERLLTQEEHQRALEASEEQHQARMRTIEAAGQEAKRSLYANAFDAVAGLGDQFQASVLAQSERGFEISKAISIAQAVVNTYQAAVGAYNALVGIPVVGPGLAVGAAAAAVSFGLAQVNAIRSTQFEGRRFGGPVRAGSMYEVNEDGPELLTVGNRTLLMMGEKGGYVSPAGDGRTQASGSGGAMQVVVNNYSDTKVATRQTTGPDGRQVLELSIRDDINNNGPISRDLARTFNLTRGVS